MGIVRPRAGGNAQRGRSEIYVGAILVSLLVEHGSGDRDLRINMLGDAMRDLLDPRLRGNAGRLGLPKKRNK